MSLPVKLVKFFKKHKVDYGVLTHPEAYTADEIAHAGHFSGKSLAKVVMAKADERDIMLVLPAARSVNLLKLSDFLETTDVRIEKEEEEIQKGRDQPDVLMDEMKDDKNHEDDKALSDYP